MKTIEGSQKNTKRLPFESYWEFKQRLARAFDFAEWVNKDGTAKPFGVKL